MKFILNIYLNYSFKYDYILSIINLWFKFN